MPTNVISLMRTGQTFEWPLRAFSMLPLTAAELNAILESWLPDKSHDVIFPCESLNRASPLRNVVTCLSPGLILDRSNMHMPLTDIASSQVRICHPEDDWQQGPCISYRIFSACLLPTLFLYVIEHVEPDF